VSAGAREARAVQVGAAARLVSEDELRTVIRSAKSWRGVLRAVGLTGTGVARKLRASADEWGVDYGHFGYQHAGPAALREAVTGSRTWTEVIARLGYAVDSGSARASVRRQCRLQQVAFDHLDDGAPSETPFSRPVDLSWLREAGGFLVAAACALRGYRVSWPLEPVAYDLVVDVGGHGLQRVQVKTATSRNEGSWVAWITRGRPCPVQP
jgi:hypothetical protein